MPDPTFSQSARRNLFLPIILAGIVLAGGVVLALHLLPNHDADLAITRTSTWQAHTVFKTDSIVVGQDKAQDDLYVLTTLHIDDRLHIPLFIKDFTATLTTANGETLESSAIEQPDLAPLYTTYPALKALASPPLAREATIAPGQSAEGMVLLHFPLTQTDWDHRQSATLTAAFYHQPPITIPIPKP